MLGAEASPAEAPAVTAMEAFCFAHIGAVAGPEAEALELVAWRLARPRFHCPHPHVFGREETVHGQF